MKLKIYYLMSLGKIHSFQGIKDVLTDVSNSNPRFVENEGLFMATFSSTFEPLEIKNLINENPKTFFLCEVDDERSVINLTDAKWHDHLFGHIEESKKHNLELVNNLMFNEENVSHTWSGQTDTIASKKKVASDLTKINKEDRLKMLDEFIDRGYENLNPDEKILLNKLSQMS